MSIKLTDPIGSPGINITSDNIKQDINIYHFGDSLSDPGNLPFELPKKHWPTSSTRSKGDVTFETRMHPEYRYTNGQIFPYFIAEKLGMRYLKGSEINVLPRTKNLYVNFSIAGAGQKDHFVIAITEYTIRFLPSLDFASFAWQIKNFKKLISGYINPKVHVPIKVSPRDIFMYMFIGPNDLFIMNEELRKEHKIFDGIAIENNKYVSKKIDNYVNDVIDNLKQLYQLGMRRIVLGTTDDVADSIITWKYDKTVPGTMKFMQSVLTIMHDKLFDILIEIADREFSGLEIYHLSLCEVLLHIGRDELEFNSLADNGSWLVDKPSPSENIDKKVMFIDDVHPTENVHKLFADYILNWMYSKNI